MINRFSGLLCHFGLIAMFLMGCTSMPPLEEMEPDEVYEYLYNEYQDGDYTNASEGFSFFTINYSAHAKVDSAQFLMGMSHYEQEEYLLAADSFEGLTRRFPSSPLVPEAMFMIGQCYWEMSPSYALDQTYTNKTIDAMQTFIDYFPERTAEVAKAQQTIEDCRDRLARKKFENARIYMIMKDYKAAAIYFEAVISEYYDTKWAAEASYLMGENYRRAEQPLQAIESFRNFLQKYPDHEHTSDAKNQIRDLAKLAENQGEG